MSLATWNYDGYFRKVFSDSRIYKRFLEVFFGGPIDVPELLPTKHKISDGARTVEFDFRRRVMDNYVIILSKV